MKLSDLYNSLKAINGIPSAHVAFGKTGKIVPLPALIYDVTSENGLAADNHLYVKGFKTIEVELYTRRYDATLEEAVEAQLDSLSIVYSKVCSWETDSDAYLIVWSFEEFIEPEN